METLKTLNLGLAFLLELLLALAVGFCAYALPLSLPLKAGLTVLAPAVLILFWSLFLAPKARSRMPMPGLLLTKLVLFGASAAGLYGVGGTGPAIAFGALILVNMAGVLVWKQF